MHVETIEILPVGGSGNLFQISDGEVYAHLEMESDGEPWDEVLERISVHPDVVAFLHFWLRTHGVLVGSQAAPRIHWNQVIKEVPAARFV